MHLTVRLPTELGAELDAAAQAAGTSRSQWIVKALADALGRTERPEAPAQKRDEAAHKLVALRLTQAENEAIERAAKPLGLRRNQWIVRVINGRLWDGNGRVLISPLLDLHIERCHVQIAAIGRNINQAVHAINAAAMPESGMDLEQCVRELLSYRTELLGVMHETTRMMDRASKIDASYWLGRPSNDV